jgi:hypothetical protein
MVPHPWEKGGPVSEIELLDSAFADLADAISAEDGVEIDAKTILRPAAQYRTENVALKKGRRQFGGVEVDQIHIVATKLAIRKMALLIVSNLVSNRDGKFTPSIQLEARNSDVKSIFINADIRDIAPIPLFNFQMKLEQFCWYYREIEKHPWCCGRDLENHYFYPQMSLSETPDGTPFFINRDKRDYAVINGRVESICNFAELLLNISDDRNDVLEVVLEGETGFRGVSPYSAEVTVNLPGSLMYDIYGPDDAT